MNWFKKKEVAPAPAAKKGIFSTDVQVNPYKKSEDLRERLSVTFQKGIDSLKSINEKGVVVAMDGMAMDDSCQSMTAVKMTNNRMVGLPDAQLSWYAGQGFIGWQAAAMLSQNWLIDKACTMPAKDASRHGYEITVNDGTKVSPEILEEMTKLDKKFKIMNNCVEFVRSGRIFGIRVALFEVDSKDPEYYTKPFNPDGVMPGSYKGISQIDPYWISPELNRDAAANPAAKDFYEPTWWRINGIRVHRTHLIIMRTCDLPDILKPTYIYGGIPIPQRIAERVYAAERTANEAPMLAMTKRLTVLNLDVTQAITNQEAFEAKMQIWCDYMNNFGVKVVGETEQIQQFDTSLADLDDVIMTQFQLVAAASEVPATKLLGTSPKGFNATGEFEEASYHEFLESIQQHDLSPLVERHHLLLIRSYIAPKFGIKPFSTEVNWKPVDSPTAAELAEINLKKAQTDNTLVQTGGINGADVRDRLILDKESGYNGLQAISDPLSDDEDIDSEENG